MMHVALSLHGAWPEQGPHCYLVHWQSGSQAPCVPCSGLSREYLLCQA